MRRRLKRLEDAGEHAPETPEEAEERRAFVQGGAEQENSSFLRRVAVQRRGELLDTYGSLAAMKAAGVDWSDEVFTADAVPPFAIAEDGRVSCTRDGRPVTTFRQTLAEVFYWWEVEWGWPGLVYDKEAQAFYTPEGELALSRDLVDLGRLMGPRRDYEMPGEILGHEGGPTEDPSGQAQDDPTHAGPACNELDGA